MKYEEGICSMYECGHSCAHHRQCNESATAEWTALENSVLQTAEIKNPAYLGGSVADLWEVQMSTIGQICTLVWQFIIMAGLLAATPEFILFQHSSASSTTATCQKFCTEHSPYSTYYLRQPTVRTWALWAFWGTCICLSKLLFYTFWSMW